MRHLLNKVKNSILGDTPSSEVVEADQPQGGGTPFDGVDLVSLLFGAGMLAERGSPVLIILAFLQYFLRRAPSTAAWLAEAVFGENYRENKQARHYFPGVDAVPALPEPPPPEPPARVTPEPPRVLVTPEPQAVETFWTTETAIQALPRMVLLDKLTLPDSPTAVPLGIDHLGNEVWADFASDLLHVGLYGTSGAGKDTLLRVWFATVAQRSSDALWAFLDGKGDWLTPDLADLECMFLPPAGGYGAQGRDAILTAIKAIDREAQRRQELIFPSGCRSREEYNRKAGSTGLETLPLLIVVASDVMDSVAGEVEELLAALVSKARALGIRVVASMQTPTGKSLEWRINLSTLLAGSMIDGSQDGPAIGVRDTRQLPFRPSKIPPPPVERGVFVARVRGKFLMIRTPGFAENPAESEERFNRVVAGLPVKQKPLPGRIKPAPQEPPVEKVKLPEPPVEKAKTPEPPVDNDRIKEAAKLWAESSPENREIALKALRLMGGGTKKAEAIYTASGKRGGWVYRRIAPLMDAAQILIPLARKGGTNAKSDE